MAPDTSNQAAYSGGLETQPTAGPYSIGSDHWPGLSKFIEECGEALQVVGKLIATNGDPAHWDGSDLRERLVEELSDVLAAVQFVTQVNHLDRAAIAIRTGDKASLFHAWHAEQRRG